MKKGFIVVETCENYEQVLCLETGENIPDGGILCWSGEGFYRHVFAERKEARAAINRTHHYSQAFGFNNIPEKKFCKIKTVALPHD